MSDSWRGADQRSWQKATSGAFYDYRDLLTWENAARLTPDVIDTLAILDPGPQQGLIQIRRLRGSYLDTGASIQVNLSMPKEVAGKTGTFRSHRERIQGNSYDAIIAALLRCIAWTIKVAGPKPILSSRGTNTGVPRINRGYHRQRDCYALSTPMRCLSSSNGFKPLALHIGKADSPYYERLYDAAIGLLQEAIAEEETLRPMPGMEIDWSKYRRTWRECREKILGPTHQNGYPIGPGGRKR